MAEDIAKAERSNFALGVRSKRGLDSQNEGLWNAYSHSWRQELPFAPSPFPVLHAMRDGTNRCEFIRLIGGVAVTRLYRGVLAFAVVQI